MSYFLGIDVGTSGTKTLLMNPKGKILAEATANYPLHSPKPLWTEQDPDDWWKATVATIRAVVKKAKVKKSDVKAIGLSGQMHGSVFLDKKNQVIRPALLWNDQRTAAECDEIERRAGGRERLIQMVANPALTGFTAPKILWLRNKEPKNFARLRKVLLPKDDVRRRMTGEFATDVSDASGMLLLDVRQRNWSKELLSALELDESLLAKCYESEEVTGKPRGADLREHKVTLPLISALPRLSESERRLVNRLMATSEPNDNMIGEVIQAVSAAGGLDYARERAHGMARHAELALDALSPNPATEALRASIAYVLERRS